jgi:hypothetical protein
MFKGLFCFNTKLIFMCFTQSVQIFSSSVDMVLDSCIYNYVIQILKIHVLDVNTECLSTVGWGTMLQPGRSWVWVPMRLLNFFNLPNPTSHTMALGLTEPLTEMSTRKCFWVVKCSQRTRLTTLPASVSQWFRQCRILNISRNSIGLHGLLWG